MTRETIPFDQSDYARGYLRFHGQETSLGFAITIMSSCVHLGAIRVGASSRLLAIYAYTTNRNAIHLLQSQAPPAIVIDALLESPNNEWFSDLPDSIPQVQSMLEKLSQIDLIPH